jgi:hypothetical protein
MEAKIWVEKKIKIFRGGSIYRPSSRVFGIPPLNTLMNNRSRDKVKVKG